jgi:hypothetical protein
MELAAFFKRRQARRKTQDPARFNAALQGSKGRTRRSQRAHHPRLKSLPYKPVVLREAGCALRERVFDPKAKRYFCVILTRSHPNLYGNRSLRLRPPGDMRTQRKWPTR